jgi:FKBP-type peptidyl-prolyl cis-trans isomerase 2
MMQAKEKDFVEIEYVGKIKETSHIFDLTNEKLAKKENIYNPNAKYGAKIICLGQNHILAAIDKFLIGKEIGQNLSLDLQPDQAFGNKNPELIRIIGLDVLRKQKINPFPGLQINASGMLATVRSIAGGRVTLDFNHPLAGKNVSYEIKIIKIIEKIEDKLNSLFESFLGLNKKDYSFKIEESKAKVKLNVAVPTKAKEDFKNKIKELLNINIDYS